MVAIIYLFCFILSPILLIQNFSRKTKTETVWYYIGLGGAAYCFSWTLVIIISFMI